MEWIAAGIAVVAAAAAIWQAWEARRARKQAESSADEARVHEDRAVSAAEQGAAALRSLAEMQMADREKYQIPFRFSETPMKGAKAWKWELGGSEPVDGVRVLLDPADADIEFIDSVPTSLSPGESFGFFWAQTYDSPRQVTMILHWQRPNGDEHSTRTTLR